MQTITYRDKKYPIRILVLNSFETGVFSAIIADETLLEALSGNDLDLLRDRTPENRIDDGIFFYVDESKISLPAEQLAKSELDMEYELIEELS